MIMLADRRELSAFFSKLDHSALRSVAGTVVSNMKFLKKDEALLEFSDRRSNNDLPTRIIVRDQDLQDFFAWTSTFIDALSPLSGFVPVSSVSEAAFSRDVSIIGVRARNGMIGSILIDGLLQSKIRSRVPDSILPASLRTLSAVFYQAIMAGLTSAEISDAASLWTLTRDALALSEMPFRIAEVLAFWSNVKLALLNPEDSSELGQVLRKYFNDDYESSPWQRSPWATLFNVEFQRMAHAPREERLRFVDKLLSSIPAETDVNVRSAFAGYALAMIADGDFNFWPTSLTFAMPATPLWFGLFAGGHRETNLLSANQSIGRRLLNLLRYRADDIDIDARELIISRRVRTKTNSVVDFPLATFNVLKARLAADVCGWFSIRDIPQAPPVTSRFADISLTFDLKTIVEAKTFAERIVQLLSPTVQRQADRKRPTMSLPDTVQSIDRLKEDIRLKNDPGASSELLSFDLPPRGERKDSAKTKKKRS